MSIFKSGLSAFDSGAGSERAEFLSLKDGETAEFAFLSDVSSENFISYYQHFYQAGGKVASGICLRRDGACAFCERDVRASRRFAVPVFVSSRYKVAKGKRAGVEQLDSPMIWAFGPTVLTSLQALMNRHESIAEGATAGKMFTLTRQGAGLNTTYALTFENETCDVAGIDVPDVKDYVGPLTYADQQQMLHNMGLSLSDDIAESDVATALYGEPSRPEPTAKRPTPAPPKKVAAPAKDSGWGALVDDSDVDEVPF